MNGHRWTILEVHRPWFTVQCDCGYRTLRRKPFESHACYLCFKHRNGKRANVNGHTPGTSSDCPTCRIMRNLFPYILVFCHLVIQRVIRNRGNWTIRLVAGQYTGAIDILTANACVPRARPYPYTGVVLECSGYSGSDPAYTVTP